MTLHITKDDHLCPVKAVVKKVKRVLLYKNSNIQITINTYISEDTKIKLTSDHVVNILWKIISQIGTNKLGSIISDVGTCSIRSGGIMAMALAKVEVYAIKLIGRWKTELFLCYVRKQVNKFTSDISSNMFEHEHFSRVPKLEQCSISNEVSLSAWISNELSRKKSSQRYRMVFTQSTQSTQLTTPVLIFNQS